MNRRLLSFLVVGMLVLWPGRIKAADEVETLRMRVTELEARLARLEEQMQPVLAKIGVEQAVAKQRALARERMRQDRDTYTRQELHEIETLYQVANKQWRSEAARKSLTSLVEKYGKANRTGCAILYLGQMSDGKQKLKYLHQAIESFGDCFYGDGVQVGAFARLLLAHDRAAESPDEAKRLFDEIRNDYPDAIDHQGNLLAGNLPK